MDNNEEVLTPYFTPNKPSIIDLYTQDTLTIEYLLYRLSLPNTLFDKLKATNLNKGIILVDVTYQGADFKIYLKIEEKDHQFNLGNINRILIDDETLSQAQRCSRFVKSYVEAKHDFVKAYYAQITLLYLATEKPLLIYDFCQNCLYDSGYIQQYGLLPINIVDSNLYKINYSKEGFIYTRGLDCFGIKDIVMFDIDEGLVQPIAKFISNIAKCFIENGQIDNSFKNYNDMFHVDFFICLIDIEQAIPTLKSKGLLNYNNINKAIIDNKMFMSIHMSEDTINEWYVNDLNAMEYIIEKGIYYTSDDLVDNERLLAQSTLDAVIKALYTKKDLGNLMIQAKDENMHVDWYIFENIEDGLYVLKSDTKTIKIPKDHIINFNYKGITPVNAYCIK